MLQQEQPEDFVIATGKQHSVKDIVEMAASELDMEIEWKGEGVNEVGISNGNEIIKVDSSLFRASEVDQLLGDASKAHQKLGWKVKTSAQEMIKEMVLADLGHQ